MSTASEARVDVMNIFFLMVGTRDRCKILSIRIIAPPWTRLYLVQLYPHATLPSCNADAPTPRLSALEPVRREPAESDLTIW